MPVLGFDINSHHQHFVISDQLIIILMGSFQFSVFYISVMTSVKENQQLLIINTFHIVRKMLRTITYFLSKWWKRLK